MSDVFSQGRYQVRLDWGPAGAATLGADVVVVVDVLSFSTAVTVAVDRGTRVIPCPWSDERAAALAAAHGATLAVGRLEATRAGAVVAPSLSPAGLLVAPSVPRLVLPSPNGSSIAAVLADAGAGVAAGCLRNARAAVLADAGAGVAAGCLRNARAVAGHVARAVTAGQSVAVVAAGERWADGSLRPCLEDHLGAGAVLAHLRATGPGDGFSPEASAAATLFDASRADLGRLLRECVSGRELVGSGFGADVVVAAELDACTTVPVLVGGAFTDGHV